MENYTIERTHTLNVRECPTCGIAYALPERVVEERRQNGGSWYCPNGHSLHFIETTTQKLAKAEERLAEERRRVAATRDLLRNEERSHQATRGHLTRQKKRASAGVCPCCNRTFQQLARHMKSKHPGFVKEQA